MRGLLGSRVVLALVLAPGLCGSLPASAQVTVNPLPDPASCYPGAAAGPDHVFFLRNDIQLVDCAIFSGSQPCLARRELPGDGANGRAVSAEGAIVLRPSVTGAGDVVTFTGPGFNVCAMESHLEDSEGCVGRDLLSFDPHSVAISPQADRLAIVALDQSFNPSNVIALFTWPAFEFLGSYTVALPGSGGSALGIDVVDFRVDGRYLIVDARNPVTGLWSVLAVRRSDGLVHDLIPAVAGLHLRNPQLAQTSDDHLVFDALDPSTSQNVVYAANTRTGALSVIASTTGPGYPSYTGDDGAVVFHDADAGVESTVSMDLQPVAADRLTPVGSRSRWLTDGGVPAVYRRGAWDGTPSSAAACGVICGDVDGSGALGGGDVTAFRAFLADPLGAPLGSEGESLCNVIEGPGPCGIRDVVVLRRALASPGLPPGTAQVCAAAGP